MILLLLACTEAPDDVKDDSAGVTGTTPIVYDCTSGPAVELGTGDAAYVPLTDGDAVVMTHGPQGGWHVFYSFIAWNFGEIIRYDFRIVDVDSGEEVDAIDAASTVAVAEGDAACSRVTIGLLGYLNGDDPDTEEDETPPSALAGAQLQLCLDLTDYTDGFSASDCVTVEAACDPLDTPYYPETCT